MLQYVISKKPSDHVWVVLKNFQNFAEAHSETSETSKTGFFCANS